MPAIKPKILDTVYRNNGEEIGKVGGIILNSTNMEKEELVEKLIFGIEKINEDSIDTLIIEELSLLSKEDIQLIQKRTKLKVLDGKKVLIFFLPIVLNRIYKGLKEDLKDKEVLILGDEEETIKEVIEALHKEVRFVTLVGANKDSIESISKYILEKTGLSLFTSKNIDKILANYSIIINLKDNNYIDINRVKKEALVFDLSIGKILYKTIKNKRRPIVIEEFIFKIDMETRWIESLVYSHVYEYFCEFNSKDLKGLIVNGNINNIEDFIDYGIRNKGRL
jgi:hypothetical protein